MAKTNLQETQNLYIEIKATITNRKTKLDHEGYAMFYNDMYNLLLVLYDNADITVNPQYAKSWVARELATFLIPSLEEVIDTELLENDLVRYYSVWEDCMALVARESFHHFLLYMELDRKPDRQVYSNRIEVLQPIVYYLNKMHNEPNFLDLIGSFPPGYGKSFVVNYFSAWVLGKDIDGSVLRLSYSDDLLNGFSRSIKSLILEERFQDIFPYFKQFGDKPFSKDKDSDWLIKNADTLVSHYSRTRDGAVTGVRAKTYIIFDDMTKGADEANNDRIHEKYWDQYMTEWRNRKENDLVKELTIGTMWNPKDILGRKSEQLSNYYEERDGKFRFTKEYVDKDGNIRGVVIRVPMLDENMESTCEFIYSTDSALAIKESMDEFLFSCVYQQDPIAPTGRLFAYENLKTYEFVGSNIYHNGQRIELAPYAQASLDPVRKGTDFVAMPIFKYDVDNPHIFYLVDVMFQGKSMDEVYDEIASRIIQHQMNEFVIENNTDTSLRAYIDKMLKERGYYSCEITEKYNTTKKEQRIRDENLPMRMQIVYPEQGLFPLNSEMGKFMENITKFSLETPNKHDDAPDSVALFVSEIIKKGNRGARVEAIGRPKGF